MKFSIFYHAVLTSKIAFLIILALLIISCEPNRMEVVEVFDNNAPKSAFEVSPSGEKEAWYSWYRTGIKSEEMAFEKGVPHGTYRKWNTKGIIIETGKYRDSLREGKWTFFEKEKKPYMQGNYKKGKKDGKWLFFNESGKLISEQFYRNDSSVGLWKRFQNDVLIEENSCHAANETGYFRSYTTDGKISIYQKCLNGKLNGVFSSYYPGGSLHKVGHFENGLRNGLWVEYFANGKLLKIERWIASIRNGSWVRFDENGKEISRSEFIDGTGVFEDTSWQNNRIHGEIRKNLRNGEYVRIEAWENGVKISSADYLKDSDKPLSFGFLKDGKKDGPWRIWYKSGVLKDSLNYIAGELLGEQFHYDSIGSLYKKETIFGKNIPAVVEMIKN